jgi:hypothetical protein
MENQKVLTKTKKQYYLLFFNNLNNKLSKYLYITGNGINSSKLHFSSASYVNLFEQ